MKNMLRATLGGAALLALAACGGESGPSSATKVAKGAAPSGCYVGDIGGPGVQMEFNFGSDGKAVLTMIENGNRAVSLDCTYQSGEARTALSCPGSSGISLTPLDGGDLEGDLDGTIVRYKKC